MSAAAASAGPVPPAGAPDLDRLPPLAQARAVLEWAGRVHGDGLVLTSSMGDEVLVHLASAVLPGVRVVFIDTGYHFPETLATRDAYAASRPLRLSTVVPLRTVAEQDAELGADLWARDPDRCCALRKVEPLGRALAGATAWVTGLRRADAPTRAGAALVEHDPRRGLAKVNPLAAWTDADVDAYAAAEGVTLNPLREDGYPSIGCAPCTRRPDPGADPRSGRWGGRAKTECGLHLPAGQSADASAGRPAPTEALA